MEFAGYAGFWRRLAAFIIDYIITYVLSLVLGFVAGLILGVAAAASGNEDLVNIYGLIIGMLLGLIVTAAYFAGMESSASQATLGKMALGIRVTDMYGRRLTFGRALGRFLAKILSYIILFIGFIIAAFTERKQALHDMIAGTLVVKVR